MRYVPKKSAIFVLVSYSALLLLRQQVPFFFIGEAWLLARLSSFFGLNQASDIGRGKRILEVKDEEEEEEEEEESRLEDG